MRVGKYLLTRERPGVISPGPCWVLSNGPWLHIADTLVGLVLQVVREWKHDKHLVGW